ncbi:uncharacterized protein LOC117932456 [Vitis riparia]|uniref:uncharacterized protein LOC117932456 n=1 Tax=Vitis riparia TaxID=96939 RepID=UPI00155AABC4|nr:uncharacterized protein LOC117932456 [Vitis riparia]
MSADILQFLKNKFMDELEEAEEEHPPPHDIPHHSYFLEIRKLLETKSITPSTGMKDCLYDLSIALTDCVLFLEKRKMKINKDSSQGQGKEQELWFLCKTKRKLIHIKKELRVATHHPVVLEQTSLSAVTDVATTSSSSGSLSSSYSSYYFRDQVENIANLVLGRRELDEEGFSKEIGIVGIGGCGKTLVARMVFDQSRMARRIWINLPAIQNGEIDFKKILKAMLKQCDGGQRDFGDGSVEVEKLLDALCKALGSKSYLLVFDGIWDVNLDWYFRLKERLEWRNKSNQSRIIMITTRLDGVAKRMVGPNNLYRMQPISNEVIWDLMTMLLPREHPTVVKLKDEMIYHSHGLPLAARTFHTIMQNQTYGGDFKHMEKLLRERKLVYYVMINPKDDANQGNHLLRSICSMLGTEWVSDISEVVQLPLRDVHEAFQLVTEISYSDLLDKLRIVVFGGDATTNRVLQALCDMELHPTPSIGVMPLGTQVNISISLGWGNQISDTDSKPIFYLTKLRDAEEILIDSWNFVMRTSIPDCLEIPKTLRVQHVSEDDLLLMEGDKELCGRFWNYLIIGLDAQECFGDSHFKAWPRNITLPIIVKIKDQQHQWKKLKLPRSIRSIVCLNMPSFLGGLDPWGKANFRRKKKRNFTSSFVDDGLLEIIGFRDSWHAEKFLPLNCHGTRLAQVHQIRFELCKGIAEHIYMSFDGTKWKQHTPIDDDNYMIEISYSSKTRMLATSTSKCKHKARSPTSIEYSQ